MQLVDFWLILHGFRVLAHPRLIPEAIAFLIPVILLGTQSEYKSIVFFVRSKVHSTLVQLWEIIVYDFLYIYQRNCLPTFSGLGTIHDFIILTS